LDASDLGQLVSVLREADLFINGLPFMFEENVVKAAIQARRSGVSINGFPVEVVFKYDGDAREADILVIAGLGATPGITNALVRHGVRGLDEVEEIHVSFAAWRPVAFSPALLDTCIFELHPEREVSSDRQYYIDGHYIWAPPFSQARRVKFPEPIGEQVVYCMSHPEAYTIPKFIKAKRVYLRGTWPPKVMELFRWLVKYGFLKREPIKIKGVEISPLEFVREYLLQAPEGREFFDLNPDVLHYALHVEIIGRSGGMRVRRILTATHPPWDKWGGERVYAKFVAIPLSVGAQMLAKGEVEAKGILPPEACLPTERFFEELKKRGFIFEGL